MSDDRDKGDRPSGRSAGPATAQQLARALDDLRAQQVEVELREEEIRRAGERYQLLAHSYTALFDLAPSPVLEISGLGSVSRANPAAQSVLPSVRAGALLSQLALGTAGRDQLLQIVLTAQRLGRAAGLFELSSRFYRVEAVRVPGSPEARTLVLFTDTTDRVPQAESVDTSDQVRSLLRGIREAALVLHEGEVLFHNDAWSAFAGVSAADSANVLRQQIDGRTLADKLTTLAESDKKATLVLRLPADSPDESVVEFSAVTLIYEAKACVLVLARDVTQQRRLEEQVARNERLASLGMLIAGVAHEINNPLTYALGNLESLLERIDSNPRGLGEQDAREALSEAIDGCQRVATIVRELRSFYRSDEQEASLLDLSQVVQDAVRMVAPKCATVARLVTDLGDVPPVLGVQTSLVQVLINLIVNALEAMPDRDPSENVICISTSLRGTDIRLEVADNGRGIAAEELGHIFEPFYSRGKASGTGLGLSISRDLIEQASGWIDVESRVGTGTRFIVHFEAARVENSTRPSEPAVIPRAALARACVLVVDDDPLVGRSVARMLSAAKEVVCVESLEGALSTLAMRADIDLVITDLLMPDGGALALMREAPRLGFGALPIVVMTGLEQVSALDVPWVSKPVSRAALMRAIVDAFARAKHRQSLVVQVEPSESAAFRVRDGDDDQADSDAAATERR